MSYLLKDDSTLFVYLLALQNKIFTSDTYYNWFFISFILQKITSGLKNNLFLENIHNPFFYSFCSMPKLNRISIPLVFFYWNKSLLGTSAENSEKGSNVHLWVFNIICNKCKVYKHQSLYLGYDALKHSPLLKK